MTSPRFVTDHRVTWVLVVLLATDLFFIIMHIMLRTKALPLTTMFSLERDGSYPEYFQYAKIAIIIIQLCFLMKITGNFGIISWVLLFVYLLSDDAFRIHERFGEMTAEYFNFIPPFNLRKQDIGEIVFTSAMGIFLISNLFWEYRNGSSLFRKLSLDLTIGLTGLIFFGMGMDFLHAAIDLGRTVGHVLGSIEDGGEMIVISLIVWYLAVVLIQKGKPSGYLHGIFTRQKSIE